MKEVRETLFYEILFSKQHGFKISAFPCSPCYILIIRIHHFVFRLSNTVSYVVGQTWPSHTQNYLKRVWQHLWKILLCFFRKCKKRRFLHAMSRDYKNHCICLMILAAKERWKHSLINLSPQVDDNDCSWPEVRFPRHLMSGRGIETGWHWMFFP